MTTLEKKTIIFDCDGVILDSNQLKSSAFQLTLEQMQEPAELIIEFIDYHKRHGGVSRFEKFKYYYTQLRALSNPTQQVNEAVERYGVIVQEALAICPIIPGIDHFLTSLQKRYRVFLISGGAEDELRIIFAQRRLAVFFENIYGSPRNKFEILSALKEQGALNKPLFYFGDSEMDQSAADQFGFEFVFVYGASEWKTGIDNKEQLGCPIIANFNDPTLATLI